MLFKVTKDVIHRTVPAHMFFKFKTKADGSFDKCKGRLVATGNHQNPLFIGETYARTVNSISVKTQLALTAQDDLVLSSYDITGAFLLQSVEPGKLIYILVPANISSIWAERYPELKKYLTSSGKLYFQLAKYIYGLAESPHQFKQTIRLNNETIRIFSTEI